MLDGPPARTRPLLPAAEILAVVRRCWGLEGSARSLPSERDQNLLLDCGSSGRYVVKLANRQDTPGLLAAQNLTMDRLAARWSAEVPKPVCGLDGSALFSLAASDGESYSVRLLTFVEGCPSAKVGTLDHATLERIGRALGELGVGLDGFAHPALERQLFWDLRQADWLTGESRRITDGARRRLVERLLLQLRGRLAPLLDGLPRSVIHNDANDENLLLAPHPDGGWQVAGLLDFGDMLTSCTVGELAVGAAYALFHSTGEPLVGLAALAVGYDSARHLEDAEIEALFPLVCLRLAMSVTASARNVEEDPDNPHVQISSRPAWALLERLCELDWWEAEDQLRDALGRPPRRRSVVGQRVWSVDDLLEARRRRIAPSLSLAYREPLAIVGGRGQYLFDERGRAWLDCVNNVCHIGHSHPRVVAAMARQAAILNTNTRYLHPLLVEYADRLVATLPEPLSVCCFVNSGSEANELAVRLARTHTGRRDVVVIDGAYHGNTATLVDLSPYKCEGPGGGGLPDWVHKVTTPDPYRGPHRGAGLAIGEAYATEVGKLCRRLVDERRPPALFLAEPILGCCGQVALPEGYLRAAFRAVRGAGGVCIVDEVQVGFGRAGSHFWAFETQGVVPDIVTMGKPIGNGHPLAAVVTTPAIAASFANGMEFFATFGGNPVSCAVGLAVLDVIEEEQLQAQAARVGAYLVDGFRELATRHPMIGDVRGLGLFLGVELVRDRTTLEPAGEETARLIELVKGDGILLSAEGPFHNVLKIKPPLVFGEPDADLLLGAADRALSAVAG